DATGMGHTLWREFDSASARWTAPDPSGGSMELANPQTFNRYSYVNNDPANQADPKGLRACGGNNGTPCTQTDDYKEVNGSELDQQTFNAAFMRYQVGRMVQGYIDADFAWGDMPSMFTAKVYGEPEPGGVGRAGYAEVVGGERGINRTRIIYGEDQLEVINGVEVVVSSEEKGVYSDIITATLQYSTTEAPPLPTNVQPQGGLFTGDVRGHIIGRALGGLPISKNLFSQDPKVNNSEYKSFEYSIRRTLTDHKNWSANLTVTLIYNMPAIGQPVTDRRQYFRPIGVSYYIDFRDRENKVVESRSRMFSN
ncbi:MAG: DNA/RNA non-specific endonuclease, partial [Metakosakonia sp.]